MFLCRMLANKFVANPSASPARSCDRPSCESPLSTRSWSGRCGYHAGGGRRSGRGRVADRFAFGLPIGALFLEVDGGARVGAGVDDREQVGALLSRGLSPGSSRWRPRGPLETGIGRPREPALVGLDHPEALRHLFLGGVVAGDGEEWQRGLVGPGRLSREQYSERDARKPGARTIQMQSCVTLHR
jgi:hypothetical protein